ncbi:type 2 periplasmic-binding domain-containing protein [Diplocloster modestus]|uniref:Uncharacterized protein n=1 Tax=Diplocloster modestus TaxID=2850322 RepID=A0ABS6KD57_9FIRM|nr:hypothetical protein [Diplocloster modestus]MBU9728440.1 hypothetical protein [Diplocloster modestus]
MRKLWSILLVGAMIFSLTACASEKSTGQEAQPENTSGQEETKKQEGDTASEGSKKAATLTIMGSEDCFSEVELELYQQFEDETGIAIELIINPNDMNNSILGAKIATKELPDVVAYFNGEGGRSILMSEDNFLPITDDPCLENVNKELMKSYRKMAVFVPA